MEPKVIDRIDEIDGVGQFQKRGNPGAILTVDVEDEKFIVHVADYGFIFHDNSARLMTWKKLENLKRSLGDYAVQARYGLKSWHPMFESTAQERRMADYAQKSSTPYLPDWLRRKVLAAFRGKEMETRPGYFVIWDEHATNALCRLLGIVTGEQPEYDYGAFKIRFDWNLQRFIVSA
ncbi:MAG: hypothetical protein KJ077_10840 [Anaerolineae bacterium]|nr:hypothetical protein [Anaerolineae bacterium]